MPSKVKAQPQQSNATPVAVDELQGTGVSTPPKRSKTKSATKTKGKKRYAPIRWTLAQAASEFDINPKTISKRAKESGLLPGRDGRFSTSDIHSAICGDYERERTRKMTETADAQALDNARERGELVDKNDLLKRFETTYVEVKQAILNSSMSDTEKNVILTNLAQLHAKS